MDSAVLCMTCETTASRCYIFQKDKRRGHWEPVKQRRLEHQESILVSFSVSHQTNRIEDKGQSASHCKSTSDSKILHQRQFQCKRTWENWKYSNQQIMNKRLARKERVSRILPWDKMPFWPRTGPRRDGPWTRSWAPWRFNFRRFAAMKKIPIRP